MSFKINWLVAHSPPRSLVLQQSLTENAISYSLAKKYAQSGWLRKLSSGAYYRLGKRPTNGR
nr:AbiEi antitoxin N-terminal domain-containing protein [Vibrio ouci]